MAPASGRGRAAVDDSLATLTRGVARAYELNVPSGSDEDLRGSSATPRAFEKAASLVKRIGSQEAWVSRSAARTLEDMGDVGVAAFASCLASEKGSDVRKRVWSGDGDAGCCWDVTPSFSSTKTRSKAAKALQRMAAAGNTRAPLEYDEPESAVVDPSVAAAASLARQAMHGGSRETRVEAAKALGGAGEPAAPFAEAIAAQLRETDADTRRRAAEALGLLGAAAEPYAEALADSLADGNAWVRCNASKALQQLGRAGASALVEKLRDPVPLVWRTAAQTLERMGEIGADALASCLKEGDAEVWRRAEESLRRMKPVAAPNFGEVRRLILDKDPGVRMQAFADLRAMGGVAAPISARLSKKLVDGDAWHQRRISEVLANTGEAGTSALASRLGLRYQVAEELAQGGTSAISRHAPVRSRLWRRDRTPKVANENIPEHRGVLSMP